MNQKYLTGSRTLRSRSARAPPRRSRMPHSRRRGRRCRPRRPIRTSRNTSRSIWSRRARISATAEAAASTHHEGEVDQLAYIAAQTARLAQARAAAKADDARVAQGQAERDRIQADARSREANVALAQRNEALEQRNQATAQAAKLQAEIEQLKASRPIAGWC